MDSAVTPDWDVIVIGAGAAGLLAAARAAERGRRTLLLEKNRKPGVKILMSGGTRCNLTHATDARGIVQAFGMQGRFLHSCLASLGPQDLVDLFEAEGVATKVEATGKIFPASDKAADVLQALLRRLGRSGAQIALDEAVQGLAREPDVIRVATRSRTLTAGRVILTTGGCSYPGCGTTGDGYAWAQSLGHTVLSPRPALVPITTNAGWVHALKGVTVAHVAVNVCESCGTARSGAPVCRGSLLFTHFGISGPVVLDVSRQVTGHPRPSTLLLECDFVPSIDDAELDAELRRKAAVAGRRTAGALLPDELPRRLADALLAEAGIDAGQRAAELNSIARTRLVAACKHTHIPVSGTRGFAKAEVTAGGVALDEVDSRTMQSRIVPELFLAGEILDLDGPIGGFNFQAAFSTGWVAGSSV